MSDGTFSFPKDTFYYHLSKKALTQSLSDQFSLFPVVAERNDLKEKYHGLHRQLSDIVSNQTAISSGLGKAQSNVTNLADQVRNIPCFILSLCE